jgi:hypothetical protein
MIPSNKLREFRRRQARQARQRHDLRGHDDANLRIRPGDTVGYQTAEQRVRLAAQRSRAQVARREVEGEIDEEEEAEENHVNYGGRNDEERDSRILGWAGSVANAEQKDDDALERDDSDDGASRVASPPNSSEEDEAEEADNGDSRGMAAANVRALGRQQLQNHTRQFSPRHRPGGRALVALIYEEHFAPVFHLGKPAMGLHQLSNKYRDAHLPFEYHASFSAAGKPSSDLEIATKSSGRDNRKGSQCSRGTAIPFYTTLNNAANSSPITRGRRLVRDHPFEKQAVIKYFDRDDTKNAGLEFEHNNATGGFAPIKYNDHVNSSESSSAEAMNTQNTHNRGQVSSMSLATGVHSDVEVSSSAASEIFGDAMGWFLPTAIDFLDTRFEHLLNKRDSPDFGSLSLNEYESSHDRDWFPDSGYEQPNLDYGFEPYGTGHPFSSQTCLLDSDGHVQPEQEAVSNAGDSAADVDDEDDHSDPGSASGNSRAASENNGAQEESDGDQDGEGGEQQDHQSDPSDNASDGSSSSGESASESGNEGDDEGDNEAEGEGENQNDNNNHNPNNLAAPAPTGWYQTNQVLSPSGGFPDHPFAGPQTRQNTTSTRMRDQPLAPGQGYVSIPIAQQHAAQILLVLEEHGREGLFEDSESERGQVEDDESEDEESEDDEDGESGEEDSVKEESVKDESDGGQGVKDESDGGEDAKGGNVKVESDD